MRISTEHIDVVILASGINRISLFEGYTPGYKALLPFDGKPAIEYVLQAVSGLPAVNRTCIVGPEDDIRRALGAQLPSVCEFVPGGDTLLASILGGLRRFADSPLVLIVTADLPLVSSEALSDFLSGCASTETDYSENAFLSVVPETSYSGLFAKSAKGFNRFRDIAVCHGNVFLVQPQVLENMLALRRINDIYNARKSAIKSALAIGFRVGVSYVVGVHLLHLLTLQQMSRIASWRFGIGLIPVIVERPELTIDVDEPADYQLVKEQLANLRDRASE